MIVSSFLVHRLVGSSDILYIGSTESIGGVERTSRLWTYRYPNKLTNEARMRDYIERLAREGKAVSLYLCGSPPNNMTVGDYESQLLQRYGKSTLYFLRRNAERERSFMISRKILDRLR